MKKRVPRIRKGQAQAKLTHDEVVERFRARFFDPKFAAENAAIERMEEIAWQAYRHGRKAPLTRKAGPTFADPKYEISVEWLATRAKLKSAATRFKDPKSPSRVLVVNASARNDGTCPGEMSKSYRAETVRKCVVDWLEDMGLVSAGAKSRIDRYIGYYEPYATSHDALDADHALMTEVRNVAQAVANAVHAMRKGELSRPDAQADDPRPK